MAVSVTSTEAHDGPVTSSFWALTLGSIGVVFGDIGTSPLYAFRVAVVGAAQGQPVSRAIVLGVLSLILWALFIVVTAKYVLLLLRADNNGEVPISPKTTPMLPSVRAQKPDVTGPSWASVDVTLTAMMVEKRSIG